MKYSRFALALFCAAFSYTICCAVAACDQTDDKCLENISRNLVSKVKYETVIAGDPEHGIESLDPMHHDGIEGNLSILKYKFKDAYVVGFKDCKPENLRIKSGLVSARMDIICPKLVINGKYEIHGRLIVLPVEGTGDFRITAGKYRTTLECDLKITPGKDGKNFLSIKNFKQTSEPLEALQFDFKNLFNGQKDLADAVLKFANENWHDVAMEVQEPILRANYKKIVKNMNKYLKDVSIEELEE